jgi:hypothetical protein
MKTVLEECTTGEQHSAVRFLWTEGLNAKDIHKERFPVCGGKCLSRKAVYNWVEKGDRCFADDKEVGTEVLKWLRQQSKTSVLRVLTHWQSNGTNVGGYVKK